jgi:protoporphyrinogen oxidase
VPIETRPPQADADLFVDVVVIGAGPTGLGAAWELEQNNRRGGAQTDYLLVEAQPRLGGSAASVTTPEGFIFDYGSHVLYPHANYKQFGDLIESLVDDWYESLPIRGVYFDGKLIPYPVQRNVHHLPVRELTEVLTGLVAASLRPDSDRECADELSLRQYLDQRFGTGLTRYVMEPLNRKMWATPPDEIGSYWASHRSGSKVANVADVSVEEVIESIVTRKDRPGWDETSKVRYPLRRGIGAIWDAIAQSIPAGRIRAGVRVEQIDATQRRLTLSDGTKLSYRHIISSVPLNLLVGMLADPLKKGDASKLRYANVAYVGLGIEGAIPEWLKAVHSFHIPDPQVACWRISFPSNFSPNTVPHPGTWSILCEISHKQGMAYDVAAASQALEEQLKARNILPGDAQILSRWEGAMEHGYPVPFLGRDDVLSDIQSELMTLGIFSRGRFGGWKYEVSNMDHAFMQGVEAVNAILHNQTETTYWLPKSVN